MRAYLFYSQGEPNQSQTAALAAELANLQVEVHNLDAGSTIGANTAALYDITAHPCALITRDDGAEVHRWSGRLPAATEISYYVHAL